MLLRSKMPHHHGESPMRLHQPDLRTRTKTASLHAIKLFKSLPDTEEAIMLGKSMLRSITRAGAFYRAALRCGKLSAYVKRLDGALYHLDLAAYWLELMIDGTIDPRINMQSLLTEVHELMAILVSSRKSAKKAGNRQTVMSSN